jgi:hypothetical protein
MGLIWYYTEPGDERLGRRTLRRLSEAQANLHLT